MKSVPTKQLAPEYSALIGLYQLMVGNTDFSLRRGPQGELCCHNAVAYLRDGMVLSIPYDFDSTGLVNPPYAEPLPSLGIRRLTQRLYRGYCAVEEHIPAAGELISSKRDEIFALVETFDDLPNLQRSKVRKFLDGYFETWDDPKRREKQITKKCLG